MRTVYLGTSAFAAAVLERLAASPHRPALVVTRPDRPRGRGRRMAAPPVADAARALDLDLDQPESVNGEQARSRIAAAEPDVLCVCAFGALIREPLLAEYEILNVHPSLLPRWRGAAPIERAIMAGDGATGVSIMRLTEGLDSGPVGLTASEPIDACDDFATLSRRLEIHGGDLLVQALEGDRVFVEQEQEGVTYAEKIGPQDRLLDAGSRSARALDRVVRALHPHIGARLALPGGALLGVTRAAVLGDGACRQEPGPRQREPSAPAPGQVGVRDGRLLLGCAPGILELLVVQPPGGRRMAAADLLRGRGLDL